MIFEISGKNHIRISHQNTKNIPNMKFCCPVLFAWSYLILAKGVMDIDRGHLESYVFGGIPVT